MLVSNILKKHRIVLQYQNLGLYRTACPIFGAPAFSAFGFPA